jgi:hypothetical protein
LARELISGALTLDCETTFSSSLIGTASLLKSEALGAASFLEIETPLETSLFRF